METNIVSLPHITQYHASIQNPHFDVDLVTTNIFEKHGQVIMIDPRRVQPLSDQPRQSSNPGFSLESIAALSMCISAEGQIEPALIAPPTKSGWDAALVDGERRHRACLHGNMMLMARVDLSITNPEEHFVKSVMANFHREGHTCIEIMYAVKRMQTTRTREQIATVFGRSVQWVDLHISLMRLDEALHPFLVDQEVEQEGDGTGEQVEIKKRGRKQTGKLTFQLALVISGLPKSDQMNVAKEVLGKRMPYDVARRYVLRYIDDNGIVTKYSKRSPSESFQSLEKAAGTAENKFGVFIDKNPRTLRELFDTQSPMDRRLLAEKLRLLSVDISSLADILSPQ